MVDHINRAGTKAAFQETLEAIRTLKSLEQTGREAGPGDKALMTKFSGFGAVATKAFPDPVTGEYAKGWDVLGQQLRELLTDEEYASAKATTFSAFYTSDVVMREMHRALSKMGIGPGARGLEPGCGVGRFMGAAPVGLSFVGIEQDSISGRMAKLTYPEHDIRIEGFQDTQLPDGSVDFAIGNVPFAEIKLRHKGRRHSLHDFFFLKSLDAVRPGGVMALVTSRYTLDKVDGTVRELLGQKADFAGAIRLPGDTFKDQGTDVVTDIIFLRRRPHELEAGSPSWATDDSWLTTSKVALPGGEVVINDYFRKNPQMVLGTMSVSQGMYNNQTLRVRSDGELAASLHAAIDGLPENIVIPRKTPLPELYSPDLDPSLPEHIKEGSFFIAPDQSIMQVVEGQLSPVMLRNKPLTAHGTPGGQRLGALIRLRDQARAVLKTQKDGEPAEIRDSSRAQLKRIYAEFRARFGPINKTTLSQRLDGGLTRRMPNLLRFRSDPDVYLVMALEEYNERTGGALPAAIMEHDVVTAPLPTVSVDSAKDGLLASLNEQGRVDIPYIASLYGHSEEEVVKELGGLIFFDPVEDAYVPADEYLSSNVRKKLQLAESSDDPRTFANVRALEQVQPEDLVAEEIDVTLGTPWIPAEDVHAFLVETLRIAPGSIRVEYVQREALWKVRPDAGLRTSALAISEYGTEKVDAFTLTEQALNMRSPTVRRRVPGGPGESETLVVDQEATLAAREKQAELKAKFSSWAFEDRERSQRLVRFYNENFNNLKLREFDGSHLSFDRMSAAITMRPHQKDAIWRNMASGNTLLAHAVGAGKTFTMVASGMEMRRTGLAKKPLFVVPNHMLEQFAREFLVLYPDANILVATKQDLTKARRQLLKSRIATGEWDGIVMTHSSFEKIAMSPEFQERFLETQVAEYEELLTSVKDRSLSRNITKRVEKLKASRKEKLKEMARSDAKDGGLYFDELGVDQIFVDEAHMFKNLETPTKMDRVAGIQTGGSNRAFDLLMKARFLQSRTPGRGLTFATGTPVSNSLGEMYTMMRYLMPGLLAERGIEHFDAWAAAFGEVVNALEVSPDGQSLRVNTRFAKFKNLPELLSLFRLSADVRTTSQLSLPTPELKGGKAEIVAAPMSDTGLDFQQSLVTRYERVRAGGVDPRDDNALKIITDGRKLALDARLVNPLAEDDPESKINQLVDKVHAIWERTREARSTQTIFSDLGVSETDWGFCVYDDIIEKLEARGIPREEIANIGDAATDQKKEALFKQVRSGSVRVLLGSTTKMGTGMNVQERLCALHHVDPPWRPADIEQREGRILRQGNRNDVVEIYRYVTKGSFDAFMWQTLETKAKFIAQAMAGDAGTRRADDIGGVELSFAEVKAIATGNPAMLVLAEMDLDVRQLTLLRRAHLRDQAKIAAQVEILPGEIESHDREIASLRSDIDRRLETKGDKFAMQVGDLVFKPEKGEKRTARQRADAALALAVAKTYRENLRTPMPWEQKLGTLGGLDVVLTARFNRLSQDEDFAVTLEGAATYHASNIVYPWQCPALTQHLEHTLGSLDKKLALCEATREQMAAELERYQERADVPFASEAEFQQLVPLRDRLKVLLRGPETDDQMGQVEIEEEIRFITEVYRGLSLNGETIEPAEQQTPVSPETEYASEPVLEAEQQQIGEAVESEPVEATHLGNREIDLERSREPAQAGKAGEAISPVTTRDDAIAIVSEADSDGISWFHLAVKVPGHDSWNLQSIYPQHSDRQSQSFEPNRKGYGWQDESWVRSHLVANEDLGELLEYLTTSERGRLILDQRSAEPQSGVQADSGKLVVQAGASEVGLPQQSAPDEPAHEEPKPAGQNGHAVNRGQLGLFDELPSPATTRSVHVLEPIPGNAVQMGLFDDTSPAANGEQTIVARAFREAALLTVVRNGRI